MGYWESKEEIAELWQKERTFEPNCNEKERNKLYDGWKKAVAATRVFKNT